MRTWTQSICLAGLLAALASRSLLAQTVFPEVEPNSSKVEATLIACLAAGDSIQGVTTGSGTSPGDPSDATIDYFRVRTCPLAPGIYRHRLVLSHPQFASMGSSVRGLNQTQGTIGTLDRAVQLMLPVMGGIRYVQWYGFGRSEEIYMSMSGTAATTGPYTLTLESVPVAPVQVPGNFIAGSMLLEGTTTADSHVWVHDQSPAPMPGYSNDDVGGSATPFGLTRTYAPGTYFMAVGTFGLTNDQVYSPDDHSYGGNTWAMDFPNSLVRYWHPSTAPGMPADVSFRVTDGVTTSNVAATQTEALEILWFRFEVQSSAPTTVYCLGDGSATACPCGNNSAPAEQAGCAHSFGLGGRLTATGTSSVSSDTLTLSGTQMPNSSALYFQGTQQHNGGLGVVFGDGLRCASGTVIRLGTKTNQGGTSAYPGSGDQPISIKGQIPLAGGTRTYQCWYRNAAAFCTAQTFNLTNGVQATWVP